MTDQVQTKFWIVATGTATILMEAPNMKREFSVFRGDTIEADIDLEVKGSTGPYRTFTDHDEATLFAEALMSHRRRCCTTHPYVRAAKLPWWRLLLRLSWWLDPVARGCIHPSVTHGDERLHHGLRCGVCKIPVEWDE